MAFKKSQINYPYLLLIFIMLMGFFLIVYYLIYHRTFLSMLKFD